MGNYKFRLADMMPNAWFHKLRDMSKKPSNKPKTQKLQPPDQKTTMKTKKTKKTKKKRTNSTFPNNSSSSSPSSMTTTTTTTATVSSSTKPSQLPYQRSPRKSYYFTRGLADHRNSNSSSPPAEENPRPRAHSKSFSESQSPRRSSSGRTTKTKQSHKKSGCAGVVVAGISNNNACAATLDSARASSSEYSSSSPAEEEEYSRGKEPGSDKIVATATVAATVTDMNNRGVCSCQETENEVAEKEFVSSAKLGLSPIATKPKKKEKVSTALKPGVAKRSNNGNNSGSPGIRLRINNSPRITSRRVSGLRKSAASKSLSESFAVVKSSFDPQRDFRESMVEMIVENNIRASKDLEDLLACYLSLNSDEYHGLIIKVFKQIWFDLTNISN